MLAREMSFNFRKETTINCSRENWDAEYAAYDVDANMESNSKIQFVRFAQDFINGEFSESTFDAIERIQSSSNTKIAFYSVY